MKMLAARILIVDDFEPFRRTLRPILEQEAALQIIGEASDGLEAVQKAEELQPDLILLDIGLPRLNGIEVARRVSKLVPHARILFFSQEFSFGIVQAALRLGALGYVHKQRAASELLPAVKAVLSDRPFVSSGLNGAYAGGANGQIEHNHEVVFCSSHSILLEGFAGFIVAAQESGDPAIVIATRSHLDELFQRLQAHGLPVEAAIEAGSFVALDANEVLSSFMVDDTPDPVRFFKSATALIDRVGNAAANHRRIAACGECAPLLLAEGKADAAIRLEQFWDQLAKAFKLDILCAYASESLTRTGNDPFHSICAEHSAISFR